MISICNWHTTWIKSKLQVGSYWYHVVAALLFNSQVTCFFLFIPSFFFLFFSFISFFFLFFCASFDVTYSPFLFCVSCLLLLDLSFFYFCRSLSRFSFLPLFKPLIFFLSASLFFVSFLSRLIPCCLSFSRSSLPFLSGLYSCKVFCRFSMGCRVPFVTEVVLVG